jgi:hypothetical protein
MAADLVPICLNVTSGDLYTLWAPRWRDAGDEWEAFLGKDDDLYGFHSAADLVAFVRSDTDNDLADHPGWTRAAESSAHRLTPDEDHRFDLVGVEELLAEKPSEESVRKVANTLAITSAIGTVCELPAVTKFFNGNPALSAVNAGYDEFTGKSGAKRWNHIAAIVGRGWDGVLSAVDEIVTTPDVDPLAAERAAAELDEPAPEEPEEVAVAADLLEDRALDAPALDLDGDGLPGVTVAAGDAAVLGGDADFWEKVGIDPIHLITGFGRFFTLRCYYHDKPIYLGRNGRISVFASERALARYLADEHDHDLADLSTYDDIRTAATDGSLDLRVTKDNVYVLTDLAEDLSDGPDTVDREQLQLAVELFHDVGEYSEDDTVERVLAADRPLGRYVTYVLDGAGSRPSAPHTEAVAEFTKLEEFVESRLRREQ